MILGRPVDGNGLGGSQAYLAGGGSLDGLRAMTASSAEAVSDITALYQRDLGRQPDAGAVPAWQGLLAGSSLDSLRAQLAQSSEAAARFNDVYEAVLGRAIDPNGLAGSQAYLAAGGSLDGLRSMTAYSAEAQADLNQIVVDYTGANATSDALASMSNSLANGANLQNIASSFANQTYASVTPNLVPSDPPDLLQLAAARTPDELLTIMNDGAAITNMAQGIVNGFIAAGLNVNTKPQVAGTQIHALIAAGIQFLNLPGLTVEEGFINGADQARWGLADSKRLDVVLRNSTGQVIHVWDFKTGVRGLSNSEIAEIIQAVNGNYPGLEAKDIQTIFVRINDAPF